MKGVFIVPTGVGAEIGGHAGDATPAAKLIASVCDKLIVHPNVVNASDINEMSENMLYVEGSTLDGFLRGEYGLKEVYSNKILLAVNSPVRTEIINAVSAARSTMGANIEIVELKEPLKMEAFFRKGEATGNIYNLSAAVMQLKQYDFDVLIVNTPIDTEDDDVIRYLLENGGVNPWGGVEAMLSKHMSGALDKPVIHAPVENSEVFKSFNDVVDARKAAELISICYLHCCIKGAHKAPKMSLNNKAHWNSDIDFLISPTKVIGPPHLACVRAGIPIISVKENKTILNDTMPSSAKAIFVENYLEAAGVISAWKAGVSLESVIRPLKETNVYKKI
jgi:hypothetical protein